MDKVTADIVPASQVDITLKPRQRGMKLTAQRRNKIVGFIGEGLTPANAGPLTGVSSYWVKKWLEDGKDNPDGPYGKFAFEVEKAQSEFKLRLLRRIEEVGFTSKQWASLMTMLERIFPDEYKRPSESTTNVNVQVGILEQRIHELDKDGELIYDGG